MIISLGVVSAPLRRMELWTACIDVDGHEGAVHIYAESKEEAEDRRSIIYHAMLTVEGVVEGEHS